MKIAHISGINYPEYVRMGNIAFTLSDWVHKYPHYTRFFKKLPVYKITDNCAAENGTSSSYESVIEAARMVNANEVWCSDKLYDCDETIRMTTEFISILSVNERRHINLVGLPQGSNMTEWVKCYNFMLQNEDINIIALSKYSVPKCFSELFGTDELSICRPLAVKWLFENGLIQKQIHCAGANDFIINEIKKLKRLPVRSIDSNIAFKMGVHELLLSRHASEPLERLNHNVDELTKQQKESIVHNIKYVNMNLK